MKRIRTFRGFAVKKQAHTSPRMHVLLSTLHPRTPPIKLIGFLSLSHRNRIAMHTPGQVDPHHSTATTLYPPAVSLSPGRVVPPGSTTTTLPPRLNLLHVAFCWLQASRST